MLKNEMKVPSFNKIIIKIAGTFCLRKNGSFDFIQLMIILIYIFLGLKFFGLIKKDNNSNIVQLEYHSYNWTQKGNFIKTKWGNNLDINNIWQEYPRPQLERKNWMNLNGLWSYSVTEKGITKPKSPDGAILVPFPIESSLSGVMRNFTPEQIIWYEKDFEIPEQWLDKNILLHFGAVDWKCDIYINEEKIGEHSGGYTAFYFDITDKIKKGINKLIVKVIDPTDKGYQPRGKQILGPYQIYYTPTSGIWQTVWLEPVKNDRIEDIEINNDFDNREIKINFRLNSEKRLKINLFIEYKDKFISLIEGTSNEIIIIKINEDDFHEWSPSEPNIYIIKAKLFNDYHQLIDSISTYTTIRKVEQKKDEKGFYRIFLNNKPFFNMGTLDQGYWPDGLYTPPSEEAMIYDIQKLKELGFNTIRKHVKIEPYRYYYECDKLGMLVWQDMPSGDQGKNKRDQKIINGGTDRQRSEISIKNYYIEWGEIIEKLKFFQCIIIWIPFNEAWGQFDTEKVVNFTREKDSTRLISPASGGNHRNCGNILDIHNYPHPSDFLKVNNSINVLGEYGGISLQIPEHIWKNNTWGYFKSYSKDELTEIYEKYIDKLVNYTKNGTSAAIYTQTTDVETEINGLITYDREIVKVYEDRIKKANLKLINSLK